MKLKERYRAARMAWKGQSEESSSWRQLQEWLGLDGVAADAQSEATYFACLKVLSEAVAKLPIRIQQYTPDHGIRIAREHRWYRPLHERPNRFTTASVFWSGRESQRNDKGNTYAWIDERDPLHPQLWQIDPDSISIYYDNACRLDKQPDIYYRYSTPQGVIVLGSEEVLHFKSHRTKENGLVGQSVREQLAATIRGNVKAQEFINRTIESGMTAKSVLNYTGSLNDENVKTLLGEISRYARGEMRDRGIENIIPMPVGYSLQPLNLKLADSQFLELRQYSALQIASAFGVKPYQVGDYTKSSYASAEAQQLSFLVDTLLYIVKQYEEELEAKLLTDDEIANGYHIKFDTEVLLRTEFKELIATLSTAVSTFLLTPNEAREQLNRPHMPGGDQLIGNGSTVPLTAVGVQWQASAPPKEDEK